MMTRTYVWEHICSVMKILPRLTILLLLPLSMHAAESVSIPGLGTPQPLKFADGEMILEATDEALGVQAPSFWKCGWQVQNPSLPNLDTTKGEPLILMARGESANAELVLRLRFVSADWSRADIYEIPLQGVRAGEFVEFPATTPLGEPVEQENGGLSGGESIGAVQFLFRGTGNSPLDLDLQEIRLP